MDVFKVDYFLSVFPKILKFLPQTLLISFLALIISLVLGFILAIIRQYRIKFLYGLSNIYVSFFRGTPFIAQMFLFYYGFAQFSETIKRMSPFTAILIVLGLISQHLCLKILDQQLIL